MKKHVSKIAIVGTGTLFPESLDSMALWRNIIEGKDLITDVPPSHWMISDYYDEDIKAGLKTYSKRGAFLPEVDFNPMEFGMPPKTMTATDTVQTLSLLVCKKLIEDTNSLRLEKVNKKDISVILGIAAGTELIEQMSSKIQKPVWVKALRENGLEESVVQAVCGDIEDSYPAWTEDTFPGLLANVVAGRITNRFDFGGVNCVVDAACASSVSAMMMAVQQLQLGNADLVITGGADALNNIFMYMCFSKTPALSHSGDIRPFSAEADGTMLGEGVTMMALRRLEDAERDGDKVYAVLNSVGASSDGRAKSVYAPAAKGQALAIEQAYAGLDYSLRDVELVEAHGTGTAAGDAAEFEGLKLAFEKAKAQSRQYCALGSIKSQFGHTKSSAGAAGVFKAAMALHHKVLPPTIKVDAPNPALEIEKSPFYLNTESRPWVHDTKTTRKASVSSFGFGGSNYHVALEEYRGPNRAGKFYHSATELVLLDARDADELEAKLKRLFESYEEGRFWVLAKESQEQFDSSASMRLALIAEDKETLKSLFVTALGKIRSAPHKSLSVPGKIYYESQAAKEKIAFLFSGQGSQYPNMGAGLAMSFSAARRPWDLA
ncbi:MAG: 3-oxoacyl-ACP reductase, partial [Deltaproteobacteria bacterium]|nr:3-oxoacyl-ACP reductase [Deltaproteobacteria bacterium]